MGEVYLARDSTLKREVAIKVLPEGLADDAERLARLEREAHLLASLNHPHIATIHSLEEAEGVRFLVLELVRGESLEQQLAKGAFPVEKALGVFCSRGLSSPTSLANVLWRTDSSLGGTYRVSTAGRVVRQRNVNQPEIAR